MYIGMVTKNSSIGKKIIRFYNSKLYILINDKPTELGLITTRKGGLTRAQKLKAVAANGEWVIV